MHTVQAPPAHRRQLLRPEAGQFEEHTVLLLAKLKPVTQAEQVETVAQVAQ